MEYPESEPSGNSTRVSGFCALNDGGNCLQVFLDRKRNRELSDNGINQHMRIYPLARKNSLVAAIFSFSTLPVFSQ